MAQTKIQKSPVKSPRYDYDYRDPSEIRKVYDNIHGFIYFPQQVWDFIDTPHFQRLRKIKQLSTSQYVFPGATHSRFEHSLGTAHLALTFLNALIENNKNYYPNETQKDKKEIESARKTITLAGLLHDLGHGPFSHTFDSSVVKKIHINGSKEEIKWKHQIASEQLFKDLVKNPYLSMHLSEYEIQRVIDLIRGEPDGTRDWEFQIISNKINGIDVDKLDYFRRDAFHLGAKHIYVQHDLLFKEAKIIDNEICYPTKYAETVYNIFYSRYRLYKNYYLNIVSKGIELMICDILKAIEGKFKFKQICEKIYTDPSQYIKLNDHIIENVEYIYDNFKENPQILQKEHHEKFQKAMDLINRIKKRQIYKFVREFHYYIREGKDEQVVKFLQKKISQQNIIEYLSTKISNINTDNICVVINEIGFGLTQANPLKKVGFFVKQLQLKKLQPQNVQSLSMLYTNAILQKSIKIFVKDFDKKFFNDVKKAFEDYFQDLSEECKRQKDGKCLLEEGPTGTPFRTKTPQKELFNEKISGPSLQN